MSRNYDKTPLSIQDQAQLLIDRGLICEDKVRLERYLSSIGYYRLSAYWLPFEQSRLHDDSSRNHLFIPNTRLEKILSLYIFDRKLRLLVMEAIERIEVALRAHWSNSLALHGGGHAYMKTDLFKNPRQHIQDLAKIDRTFDDNKEAFIQHYKQTYSSPPLPPIWAVVETMTLGTLSRWFQNTKDTATKKTIMTAFAMPTVDIIESVFHTLTPVRNVCAHHNRLWNRCFVLTLPDIKRMRDSLLPKSSPKRQANHLYNYLVVIESLMRAVSPQSRWKNRLMALLDTIETNDHKAMGFPDDWKERKPWKTAS